MKTLVYNIPSIHCIHCTHTIETELNEIHGVKLVKADLENKSVTVTFDAPADDAAIRSFLAEIEYPAS
jgi:copper chaperone